MKSKSYFSNFFHSGTEKKNPFFLRAVFRSCQPYMSYVNYFEVQLRDLKSITYQAKYQAFCLLEQRLFCILEKKILEVS